MMGRLYRDQSQLFYYSASTRWCRTVTTPQASPAELTMPKYFFHIQRGDEIIADDEGIDLPHLEAVRQEGPGERQGAAQSGSSDRTCSSQAFVVKDAAGQIVLTLNFEGSFNLDSPAG